MASHEADLVDRIVVALISTSCCASLTAQSDLGSVSDVAYMRRVTAQTKDVDVLISNLAAGLFGV